MEMENIKAYYRQPKVVEHYASAAINLGLWVAEEKIFTRIFRNNDTILELGCGTGRIAMGLYELGYNKVLGIDYSREMIMRARQMAKILNYNISFQVGDATQLNFAEYDYDGAIFGFNGLMQIPGRDNRRLALSEIYRVIKPDGFFVFTSHDRELKKGSKFWKKEKLRWHHGKQKPDLLEYGDRYEMTPLGNSFIHVPTRMEVIEDLKSTGFIVETDVLRKDIANESDQVRKFSDECRFWVARKTK